MKPAGPSPRTIQEPWNWANNPERIQAALSFGFKSDSGNVRKGLGTGTREFTLLGIFSKNFKRSSLHFNLGPTFINGDPDILNILLAYQWNATEKLSFAGEITGSTTYRGRIDDHPVTGLLGLSCALRENVVYDLGVSIGISDAAPDLSLLTGLTFSFGNQ